MSPSVQYESRSFWRFGVLPFSLTRDGAEAECVQGVADVMFAFADRAGGGGVV